MIELSRVIPATCAALLLQAATVPAMAEQSRQFSLAKTSDAESIAGQIDWPSGKLENWAGPVVVIVPGYRVPDRDGWSLLAVGTTSQDRSPYRELSSALITKGFAVVRFDAPEAMPPGKKCRDAVRREGLTSTVITQHCMKMDAVQRATMETRVLSTEHVVSNARNWIPGARKKLILLAMGDDVLQAAAIVDRNRVPVHGFATIGGAAVYTFESGKPVAIPSPAPAPIPNAASDASDEMPAPITVMVRRHVPGLFIWGELSGRLSAEQQATAAAAINTTVSMQTQRIGGSYHLLSQHSDDEWMEPFMVDQVATTIREFADKSIAAPDKNVVKIRDLQAVRTEMK